jgi:hypothetical protein
MTRIINACQHLPRPQPCSGASDSALYAVFPGLAQRHGRLAVVASTAPL